MPRLVVFLFNYHLEPGKTVAETRTVWLVMGADTRLSTAGPSGQAVLRAGWMLGARSAGEDSSHSSGPSALTRRLPGPADVPADAWGQRASGSRGSACSDQLPAAARWAAGVGAAAHRASSSFLQNLARVGPIGGTTYRFPLFTFPVVSKAPSPQPGILPACLFPQQPEARWMAHPARPIRWLRGAQRWMGEAERRSRTGSRTGCIWDSTGNSPVCCLQSGCVPRRPLSFPRAVLIF